MSTYYEIVGSVTVSAPALCVLQGRPSWLWLADASGTPQAPQAPEGSNVSEPDSCAAGYRNVGADSELRVAYGTDGAASFVFDDLYRNLGRYLEVDLALAQRAGRVDGLLECCCTDGVNVLSVTRYVGTDRISGASECVNGPVDLELCDPRALTAFSERYGDGLPEFHILAPRDVAAGGREQYATTTERACWCGVCPDPDGGSQMLRPVLHR